MDQKKIFFFDIDGTIYSPSLKKISKNVKNAIKKTMQKGHLCFVSTGRPYAYIDSDIKDIGFDGYILASGSHIQFRNTDIKINPIESHIVKKLFQFLKNNQIEYIAHTPSGSYMHQIFIAESKYYKKNEKFLHISDDTIEKENIDNIVKIEIHYNNKDNFNLLKSFFDKLSYEIYEEISSIDFFQKGNSKASAIQDILNITDHCVEDTYCFGDGENDIEMFGVVAYSIAMDNAIDELKNIAKDICDSVDEDGVAYKLQELFQLY